VDTILNGDFVGDQSIDQDFTVFTGVEVVPHVHHDANGNADSIGKVDLQMTPHKLRCHASNDGTTIGAVLCIHDLRMLVFSDVIIELTVSNVRVGKPLNSEHS
jgi:hypothetical protein